MTAANSIKSEPGQSSDRLVLVMDWPQEEDPVKTMPPIPQEEQGALAGSALARNRLI